MEKRLVKSPSHTKSHKYLTSPAVSSRVAMTTLSSVFITSANSSNLKLNSSSNLDAVVDFTKANRLEKCIKCVDKHASFKHVSVQEQTHL